MKSVNIYIWLIGTLTQLLISGSYTKLNYQKKNKEVNGKTLFLVIGLFCSPHSICLNIGFLLGSLVRKYCAFNCGTLN